MKLTDTQFRWLRWLEENGGVAYPHGVTIVAGEKRTTSAAAISFVNLVAKGCVEGREGKLVLTDTGRRWLKP